MWDTVSDEAAALRDQLMDFGLSEKEVDTYITLLGHGETKASVIAEDAGVSKRYVYNVLGTFEERGFVEINDHETPTTVRAVEPSQVVGHFASQLDAMEERLSAQYDPEPVLDREYEVMKSASTVRKRISSFLREAEDEVNLSIPASLVADLAPDLRNTLDRGVLTILQVNDCEGCDVDTADLQGLGSVVRYWDESGPLLMAVDRTYGVFSPDEVVGAGVTDQQAISFTEDRLTPVVVGSFLGNYWPTAREVYVDEPRDPPYEYERFRHAVFDATLHQRAGKRVVAELEARSTDSRGEFVTMNAEVTEVVQGLVQPTNNSFPIEHSLVVDDGTETASVGGPEAFTEDYESRRVTLDVVEQQETTVVEMIERSAVLDGGVEGN